MNTERTPPAAAAANPLQELCTALERLSTRKIWSGGEVQELARLTLELALATEELARRLHDVVVGQRQLHDVVMSQRHELYDQVEGARAELDRHNEAMGRALQLEPLALNGQETALEPSRARSGPPSVLDFPCPGCGAPAGSPCESEEGVRLSEPHTWRLEEAVRP